MGSLVTRVLVAAGVVLVVFLGLTVAALDLAFRGAAERAIRDRLQVQVHALLAAAEFPDEGGLQMPPQLPEARFSHAGSGLYAQVLDATGRLLWRSPSAVALRFTDPVTMVAGETLFARDRLDDGTQLFRMGLTILWGAENYHFMVAESLDSYHAQVSRFRANLLWWFGLSFAALIVAQMFILRRRLRPLRDLAAEVGEIETGRQELVRETYPRELSRLSRNLNALIRNERSHLERYRNTLADLAHSLKTPLAVIKVALEERPGASRDATIGKQVDRMNEIVRYQLQRARVVGSGTFGRAVVVAPQVTDLIQSLAKVYGSKPISYETDLDPEAVFLGSRGDLLEMLGNLLDNASKWSRTVVRVKVDTIGQGGIEITIEDDGPGIPDDEHERVLMRGTRADEAVDGQGIGLAVVREVVQRQGGTLSLGRSGMGGLKVILRFCDDAAS